MKKLQLAFLMIIGSGSLFALPTFNPMGPALLKEGFFFDCGEEKDCCQPVPDMDWCDLGNWCDKDLGEMFGFRLGYYGDFVSDRKLYQTKHVLRHVTDNSIELETTSPITRTKMTTQSALIGVSIMDRFEVFTTLGGSQAEFTQVFSIPKKTANIQFYNGTERAWTRSGFAWSVGGTAILWSCDCIAVGFNGQYFQARPKFEALDPGQTDGIWNNPQELHNSKWKWSEWQLGLGGAWWVHLSSTGDTALVPFFNIRYASGTGKTHLPLKYTSGTSGPTINYKLHEKTKVGQNFGYAVGATLVAGNRVNITVEGRWLDEKAISTQAVVRF